MMSKLQKKLFSAYFVGMVDTSNSSCSADFDLLDHHPASCLYSIGKNLKRERKALLLEMKQQRTLEVIKPLLGLAFSRCTRDRNRKGRAQIACLQVFSRF